MSTPLALTDLNTEVNHEPRLPDLVIAERLGLSDPHSIRRMIAANRPELEMHGEVSERRSETSLRGGRPGREYFLNEGQALVICALSRTSKAAELRRALIEVFMAWRRGQLANAEPAPVLPALKPGHMHMMIGSRLVIVDASDYAIGGGDEAVVCGHDGKVKIVRGPLEPQKDSPWMGKRFAAGPWRKAKAGHGVLRERPCFTIIGRLVRGDETRHQLRRA